MKTDEGKEYYFRIEPYMGCYVRAEIFYKLGNTEILVDTKEFKRGFFSKIKYTEEEFKQARKWVDSILFQIWKANKK